MKEDATTAETASRMLQTAAEDLEKNWFETNIIPYISKVEEAYLLTNGEFNLDQMNSYDNFGWFIFFLATVFNLIIMLNLLLAIIADTFGRIIGDRNKHMYRERVIEITNM